MPRMVHDRFLLVCRRCGCVVTVKGHALCPVHGVLEIYDVVTHEKYLEDS